MPHPNTDPYRAKLIKLIAHRIPEVSERTIRNWIDGDTLPTPMMRQRFDDELREAKRNIEVYHPGLIHD